MKRRLVIFFPFDISTEQDAGSMLRFLGYTSTLSAYVPDYILYSVSKPKFNVPHYLPCTISGRWRKLMLIHNLLFFKKIRFVAYLFRMLINRFSHIDELFVLGDNILLYTHQDSTLGLYLYLTRNIRFVYDIHGIFALQREYVFRFGLKRRCWYRLYVLHEKNVFREAPFLNVVSAEMAGYIRSNYKPKGTVLIAPDGVPVNLENYESSPIMDLSDYKKDDKQLILFAGSFKPMGGVATLIKCFCDSAELQQRTELLLVGTELSQLDATKYENNSIHFLPAMSHQKLIEYMKAVDVIVCPDTSANEYNRICPHIKFYDALASGTPVVVTDLKVNRNIIGTNTYPLYYFSDEVNSLEVAIYSALSALRIADVSFLESQTYNNRIKQYWIAYKKQLLGYE